MSFKSVLSLRYVSPLAAGASARPRGSLPRSPSRPRPGVQRQAAFLVEIAGRVGLPLLPLGVTSAGVWSIWITAGVTWMLAGTSCVPRYVSWRKKNHPDRKHEQRRKMNLYASGYE